MLRKRYVYTLLFLVPGFFASALVVGALSAVLAGALWLFVFGDGAWPPWIGQVVPTAMLIVFCCLWLGVAVAGYTVGKRLESTKGISGRHVWMSLAATLLPIVILLLHQLSVGNLGPKSDSRVCTAYCSDAGFATSSIPPEISGERTCQCLGQSGEVQLSAPIDELSLQRD